MHDVGKEMELDLIKQYSQVVHFCHFRLLIYIAPYCFYMFSKHSIFRLNVYLLIG